MSQPEGAAGGQEEDEAMANDGGGQQREGTKEKLEENSQNHHPQQQQKRNPSGGLDPRPGGSASSAAPTDDAESQATTTNDHTVDESGDSESGGTHHNEPGKMFVGGLSWQTTAEGLRDYFCKFGEVNECMVMRDPTTKRARGFGFITFVDPTAVEKVLTVESHELDGKRIDPKIAFPKKQQPKMVIKTKKVFIGGLPSTSTLEDIKAYFAQYGKVEDAMLMFDKSTQRHRGFGFITFDDDEVSDKVCEIHFHEINGKMVECKKAQPKEVMLPLQLNKTRAAAARNLYGLAPEQLLAYASYIPRLPAAYPHHQAHSGAHHGGMLAAAVTAYPGGAVTTEAGLPLDLLRIGHHHPHQAVPSMAAAAHHFAGNGHHFAQGAALSSGHPSAAHQFALGGPSGGARSGGGGHQMGNNGQGGGLNARDFAAAQLVAQQQAVYEAMVYANQLSLAAAASASVDFSGAPAYAHQQQQQHSQQQQQQAMLYHQHHGQFPGQMPAQQPLQAPTAPIQQQQQQQQQFGKP